MNLGSLTVDVAQICGTSANTFIDSAIERARARIYQDLRVAVMENGGTLTTMVAGIFALPANWIEFRRLEADGVPLRGVNPHELSFWESTPSPQVWAILAGQLRVPAATSVTATWLAGEAAPVNPSDAPATMVAHPQVWLAATMVEAALQLTDEVLLRFWSAAYDTAVAAANRAAERGRWSNAPAVIASDYYTTFGEARN